MRTIIFILLLILLSCPTQSKETVTEHHCVTQYIDYIDSTLDPILVRFEYEARIRGMKVDRSHLSMIFGLTREKGTTTVGKCTWRSDERLIIQVHTESWNKYDDYQREELIFHELGHCLIGRKHCDAKKNGEFVSLMYSKMLPAGLYKKNREDLVDELFNTNDKCIRNDDHSDDINGKVRPPKDRNPTR